MEQLKIKLIIGRPSHTILTKALKRNVKIWKLQETSGNMEDKCKINAIDQLIYVQKKNREETKSRKQQKKISLS